MSQQLYDWQTETLRLLEVVQRQSEATGTRCFLIGGFVRDLFLERPVLDKDIDLVVVDAALEVAKQVADEIGASVKYFKRFLTAKVLDIRGFGDFRELDFASARREVYDTPGALPRVTKATLEEDLRRRDFTINSMALPLHAFLAHANSKDQSLSALQKVLYDPFDGIVDLKSSTLRVLHNESFEDDPTRLIRLARYKERLSFQMHESTERLVQKAIANDCFGTVSPERLWSELLKCLSEPSVEPILLQLFQFGFFAAHDSFFGLFKGLSPQILSLYSRQIVELSLTARIELLQLVLVEYDYQRQVLGGKPQVLPRLVPGKRERKRLQELREALLEPEEEGQLLEQYLEQHANEFHEASHGEKRVTRLILLFAESRDRSRPA